MASLYDWSDYLRRTQTELYAPSWGIPIPINEDGTRRPLCNKVIGIGICGVLSMIIIIVISVSAGVKARRGVDPFLSSETETMSTAKYINIHDRIFALSGASADEGGTAQNIAMMWMLQEDLLDLQYETNPFLIQRYIMALIFFSFGGENWPFKVWLSPSQSECDFPGVVCNESGEVTAITLDSMDLTGTIPPEVGHLSSLEFLALADNNIYGNVPEELGILTKLENLYLQHNNIVGQVPEKVCTLRSQFTLKDFMLDCEGSPPVISCDCCTKCTTHQSEGKTAMSPVSLPDSNSANDTARSRQDEVTRYISSLSGTNVHDMNAFQNKALDWILNVDNLNFDANDSQLGERYVIALLYFSLGGEDWPFTDWLSPDHSVCEFRQVRCNGDAKISTLALDSSDLTGSIPSEISVLTSLTW
eukprot:CAMPEP_0195535554 /NCGR_PEP_ID=MMETSP0794_2-20130614/44472_1 /TAXON_ID=515487 /ORGANISM="Stephanopyxis turris, Strain CCMP 815" /LENGTH=417 /DNA_ID=CAMNT_0040668723 /DNA_START=61 /DNA_END=1311 /DNA_ORIENTATION=-